MNFVFQFTIFNIFVALTLMYLRDSREAFKLRSEALLKQQDQVIEREIKKDKRLAEEAKAKKVL